MAWCAVQRLHEDQQGPEGGMASCAVQRLPEDQQSVIWEGMGVGMAPYG